MASVRNTGSPMPRYVRPQLVGSKSVLESVLHLVVESVPNIASHNISKEQILWVKFQQVNLADSANGDGDAFIIIGYSHGIQVWQLLGTGEAQELVSLRQPTPNIYLIAERENDFVLATVIHEKSRSMNTPSHSMVKVLGIPEGEDKWKKSFDNTILDIRVNKSLLLVVFQKSISAYNLENFQERFTVTGCNLDDALSTLPLALGTVWLAVADTRLIDHLKCHGQYNADVAHSYKTTLFNSTKSVVQSVTSIGESILNSLTASGKTSVSDQELSSSGVVTIINCNRLKNVLKLNEECQDALVCHFQALPERLAILQFDRSGGLLFCACHLGQNFSVFRIMADPINPTKSCVQHLYILHRGDTTAQVVDVAFSVDSRWVAVCTTRGTTHVFPINPYGGKSTVRTHTSHVVVNKTTKYHKSIGMDEATPSKKSFNDLDLRFNHGALENPRIKPYTQTEVVEPVVQIRSQVTATQQPHKHVFNKNLAVLFSSSFTRHRRHSHGCGQESLAECLLVISDVGDLTEYLIEPLVDASKVKLNEDSALSVSTTARYQWNLGRTHADKERPFSYLSVTSSLLPASSKESHGSAESLPAEQISSVFDQPWLSQVEMFVYSGPSRRLWMGPQFKFKVYQPNSVTITSQTNALISESPTGEANASSDIICDSTDLYSLPIQNTQTKPVNVPTAGERQQFSERPRVRHTSSGEEIFIEAGSFDPSPRLAYDQSELFEDAVQDCFPDLENQTNILADAMQDQTRITDGADLMAFPS